MTSSNQRGYQCRNQLQWIRLPLSMVCCNRTSYQRRHTSRARNYLFQLQGLWFQWHRFLPRSLSFPVFGSFIFQGSCYYSVALFPGVLLLVASFQGVLLLVAMFQGILLLVALFQGVLLLVALFPTTSSLISYY